MSDDILLPRADCTHTRMPVNILSSRLTRRTATVAVVGLGDVGLPLLVAAGGEGFELIGVDSDQDNIDLLRAGISYIDGVGDDELGDVSAAALSNGHEDLRHADIIIVTAPASVSGCSPSLARIEDVAMDIAADLQHGQLMVIDTSAAPNSTEELLERLGDSGMAGGAGVALTYERTIPSGARGRERVTKRVTGLTDDAAQLATEFYASMRSGPGTVTDAPG